MRLVFNTSDTNGYRATLLIYEGILTVGPEGMKLTPELIAGFSPYRTSHLNRFGLFELKERNTLPLDYGIMFGT